MILRPRVAPIEVNARAANGIVMAAARHAATAPVASPVNVCASHGEARNAASANGTETASAIVTDRRTSPRARDGSLRPTKIATSRTLATSMPKRVRAAAMNANWVVRVTTP